MRPVRSSLILFLASALCTVAAFASRTHRTVASGSHSRAHKLVSKSKSKAHTLAASHKLHGQQVIAPERVTEIQQALIKQRYMTGEASGQWDAATQAAMQKFQGDQGWQTRLMPDSRALKKLGLGPDYSNALNAKDSSFSPAPASTIPPEQASGFAAAAGVNQ